ncbi:molybdopterin-binding protein [Thalassovita sp.]|uniref:molybdopterin-binding protein n=1 Tax=Thalassovita sp. TaxID=1979401 RepID=UPI0029DE5D6F|nr:molybdopterin-binding protein [Thalassovita sp.]
MKFDRVAILDWSAASTPKTGADSVWLALAGAGGVTTSNPPTRGEAEAELKATIQASLDAGERLLLGCDFSLGFPVGFAERLTGQGRAQAVWEWLAQHVHDGDDNRHSLREVAGRINQLFPDQGPFWGNGAKNEVAHLSRTKPARSATLNEFRLTEKEARALKLSPKSCWQLAGAGAVGAQTLVGLPMLSRFRQAFGRHMAVWPFQNPDAPIVVAEVYPSMLTAEVAALQAGQPGMIKDEAQVRVLASALLSLSEGGELDALFQDDLPVVAREEGWILGLRQQLNLRLAVASRIEPPRLRDDCFAMPQGVDWVPVDEALARLRSVLRPVTGTELCTLSQCQGRILSQPVIARRSNPPMPNSAVDGYGFAHAATGQGPQRLPLVKGRAAAGQPFNGVVPFGAAVRILTGAILPEGVDTVVLEEDTATDGASVVFDGPIKPRANTRKAGEDVAEGASALPAGHVLRAPDLALLSALGISKAPVHRQLRVGVLSTGTEIVPDPSLPAKPHQIWDANRPMLLGLARSWNYEPVDLGHVIDDPTLIAQRLDAGAQQADVIFTSGGASAGDEDHVSTLLRESGTLTSWRIALKPGRPLALAVWKGAPVLGLPGNPVAALVCALVFGRPALSLMAGAGWQTPLAFNVPAAFSKSKKPGRREYLRARLTEQGTAEVFKSEGSGRISGLSWANGLVELPDDAVQIEPGTPVRFLPYAGFGL